MNVDQAIEELLNSTADPYVIADRVARKRSLEIDDGFMHWALAERARLLQRSVRNHRSDDTQMPQVGPSRKAQCRAVLPFVNKFEDEATEADLLDVLDGYDKQIASGIAIRARYERLLERLRASGCATVGEMRARESVPA